jgi:hypothetical protein
MVVENRRISHSGGSKTQELSHHVDNFADDGSVSASCSRMVATGSG